jgi:hypothetical protein
MLIIHKRCFGIIIMLFNPIHYRLYTPKGYKVERCITKVEVLSGGYVAKSVAILQKVLVIS